MGNGALRNKTSIHILIAEDSPTQAQHLCWILEDEGYVVTIAKDGRAALEALDEQQFDLLISDVVMPGMDGFELCNAIREREELDLPIMLVTSLKSPNDVLKGLQAGADNFLTKPYQDGYLIDQIEYLLSNRRLRGRRKMEVGIEIEFNNERHFITADRQQILDLLISTYHEAIYINNDLAKSTAQLQQKIKLQEQQLALGNQIQKAKSKTDIFSAMCDFLSQVEPCKGAWLTEPIGGQAGQWQLVHSMNLPARWTAEDTVPQCDCLSQLSASVLKARECEAMAEWQSEYRHVCLPIVIDNDIRYVLNLLFDGADDALKELEATLKMMCQQIASTIERLELLRQLEGRVEERTAQFERSQSQLQSIVDSNLFGIILFDGDGNATYANEAVRELLGYAAESEIQRFHFNDLCTADGALPKWQGIDVEGWHKPHAINMKHAEGKSIPTLALLKRLADDQPETVCIFLDRSELKNSEERLARMQRLESIANLSGGIAHDFNNLLSVIMGNCEVLLDKAASPEDAERASRNIEKAAISGTKLTRQLLSFARQQELALEAVDVAEVVWGLSEFIERVIGSHIKVKVHCCDEPWTIYTDYNQLESALLNLAINARDAIDKKGEICIEARNENAVNTLETLSDDVIQGDFLVLRVSDTGCGIPPDILEKVFEPFFTTKGKERGTGLGLAMVHGFVKQCEGFIRVETSDKGTTVELYFPRYSEDSMAKVKGPMREPARGHNEKVLVVEDNPDVSWVVARHVSSLGYQPVVVTSAEEALKVFRGNSDEIQLVCSDFNLHGDLNGLELLQQLHGFKRDFGFILSSGSTLADEVNHYGEHDRVRFLQKPYRRQELAELMHELLASTTKS